MASPDEKMSHSRKSSADFMANHCEHILTGFIIFSITLLANNFCYSQDIVHEVQITNPTEQVKLIGQLGRPLGTPLTVQGIVIDNSSKGYRSGLNLIVQNINDSSIQELIKIPISPYFGEFGDKPLLKLDVGSTYQLRVYETGGFVGIPGTAYEEADIILQATGFYFQNKLIVLSGKKINPVKATPNNFVGRIALISGIAENEKDTAYINASEGKLRLVGFRKWAASETGKLVEVYGKIEQKETKDIYNVRDSSPGLVKLEDQIGMTVKLRGKAISLNRYWWFNYRGTDIYVERMEELSNWTVDNHLRPMEITGILEQAVLPRLDQISVKANRDSKLYYIVRKPGWRPIEKLLAIEDPGAEDE